MVRLTKSRRISSSLNKGLAYIINVTGRPKGGAVSMNKDGFTFADAIKVGGIPAQGVQNAATFAVGISRANNCDRQVTALESSGPGADSGSDDTVTSEA